MILRAQTVRRLLILLAAVMVLVGTGAALLWRNEYRKAQRLAETRAKGMEAFKAGDYPAALNSLKYYVARDNGEKDPEALFAYALSRSRIEEPNGKHVFEGITAFNTLVQIDPTNLPAKRELLDLYTLAWRNEEVLDLSDAMLRSDPDDRKALKARSVALERLRRLDGALAASEKLNELDPTDLDQQLVTYELMRKLKRSPETLVARAQKQQKAAPDDPRFALLLAMAYGNAGDAQAGKEWLNRAAEQPVPDAAFVRHLVRVLDTLKMYPESQKLLDRVTAQGNDPLILRVVVQRLWQNGQGGRVLDRLKDLDPASPDSDTVLLAYRALAAHDARQPDLAKQIVAALGGRRTDSEAVAWATALNARFTNAEPRAALQQYQAALGRSPGNAVIRFLVGEAYARLGETELAIAAWRRAAEGAPSWYKPREDIARALAAAGRMNEAVAEALAAVRAAPTRVEPAVALAAIRHKALEEGAPDAAEEARLLKLVEKIQQAAPGEPETLPVYVNLLAKAGRRDDAIAAARTVTRNPTKYTPTTALRLISVSRSHKLGIEADLQAVVSGPGAAEGETPRVALARAADLAAAGKPEEGLALLASRANSATTQPAAWRLALAQYREATRDPSARKEWVALGDDHPNDLAVQSAVLKTAASARGDREFMARSIDRLKALTGPEGQTWRLERARWLLGGDRGKDTAEAINLLNEILRASPSPIEARLLLARAMESVNNPAGAIKELQAAAEQQPGNVEIALELARLLQEASRFADARTYLERAASSPELSDESCRRVASMLARQGDLARGVRVLESIQKEDLDTAGKLLLAELYRRQNRLDDAEAMYATLLAEHPPETDAIRAAAEFYGSQRRLDDARKALARLPEAKPRAGVAELIIASFTERYGNAATGAAWATPAAAMAEARRQFAAAAKAAPRDAAVWREFVAFHLRGGRYADARRVAEEGLEHLPDDAPLKRMWRASNALVELSGENAALRPVLATLAGSVMEDRGASEFLTAPQAGASGAATATSPSAAAATTRPAAEIDAVLARLKDFVSRYPRSLPLRIALVQWHGALREYDEAAAAAARAMNAFPTDADSARIAAGVFRAGGKWNEALDAAQKWRERSLDNPRPADQAIAEIHLARGDAASALKQLAPYSRQLKADPKADRAMLATLLRASLSGGDDKDVRGVLEPMLAADPAARVLWLQLAGEIKDGDHAAAWVKQVAPLVAATTGEQTALGGAWYALSVIHRTDGAIENAAQALDPVVKADDAPADAVLLRGLIADRLGDAPAAEDLYRRGLRLNPDAPEAMNNLAYLVLLRGGDLNEAETLARRAATMAPATPGFHDTLGRILARQGKPEAAVESFNAALKLEPNNLEAMVGLATTLIDSGKRDVAANLFPQIDALLKSRPAMSPQLRKEVEALRETMKASL